MRGARVGTGGFEDFVRSRYAELLRVAYLLTGSHAAAEDLLQTCLLRVMRRWAHIDDPGSYLRRSMVNQRNSLWRRLRNVEILTGLPPERVVPDAADTVALRDELLAALAGLPVRMRAVLVLRYWEDMSEADTAAVLGISAGSVKSQASRGLVRLRSRLGPGLPGSPSPVPLSRRTS